MRTFTPRLSHARFRCVEEAEALLRRAGLAIDLLQLDGGPLEGDLLVLRLGALQLLRLRLPRAVHAAGAKPSGRQLVTLPLDPPGGAVPLRAHGHPLPATSLFGLDCRGEIHLSTAAACQLAVISLDREGFQLWAERLGAGVLADGPIGMNWLELDRHRFADLRAWLGRLFSLAESGPEVLTLLGGDRVVAEDLLPLLLEALLHAGGQRASLRSPARFELVRHAQRWMLEHPQQPIRLDALCRRVHAGRRSLIQGFREHLGMGPMAYLKLQRLHGVHRLLLAAEPGQLRIQAVAEEWGFLNAGHFARDYRGLFGELPSATLERSPPCLRDRVSASRAE